jgi:hypothetical protein
VGARRGAGAPRGRADRGPEDPRRAGVRRGRRLWR